MNNPSKYRSKIFDAFHLSQDMSNWKECCIFMGDSTDYSAKEFDGPPDFLDVRTADGYEYAMGDCFVCKMVDGFYEVWDNDKFIKNFEELIEEQNHDNSIMG